MKGAECHSGIIMMVVVGTGGQWSPEGGDAQQVSAEAIAHRMALVIAQVSKGGWAKEAPNHQVE